MFKRFGGKVITSQEEVNKKLKEFGVPEFMIKAFHGSPHRFDKFSTEFMGSGEGVQAFGWGLYFTDIKSIAEIEKLQRELERIESKSSGLGDENKNLKGEIKSLKLDNEKLQKKLDGVVKQAKCLRSAIDEHSDSENILKNAREKFNAPEQKQEVKTKNIKNKDWEIGD